MPPLDHDAAIAAITGLLFESSNLTADVCQAKAHRIMSLARSYGWAPAEKSNTPPSEPCSCRMCDKPADRYQLGPANRNCFAIICRTHMDHVFTYFEPTEGDAKHQPATTIPPNEVPGASFFPRHLRISRKVIDGEITLRVASHDGSQVENLTDSEVEAVREAVRKSGLLRVFGSDES